MYTAPILPPGATSITGTCPAEAYLCTWSVPVQLERMNIRIYELCARHGCRGSRVHYAYFVWQYERNKERFWRCGIWRTTIPTPMT
jgi:hypothetical protein